MSPLLRFPCNVILMILFSFLPLGAVVFTPGYPKLAQEFGLSDSATQWMMTLFLAGAALGRLPYGPLANRYGRKRALFVGLWTAFAGTALILASNSYLFLCFGRLIQALGCAVTLKIGYTMIGDLHQGAAATKIMSNSMFAYAIVPGIGTSIAGFLNDYLSWKGGFWFFLLFNLLIIGLSLLLPETIQEKDLHALKLKRIVCGYGRQFKNPFLVLWASLMGLSTGVLFIFAQEAPFVGMDLIGLTPAQYGMFYFVPAVGIASGSIFTRWLASYAGAQMAMLLGILVQFGSSILMALFFFGDWMSGWALFLPQIFMQIGDSFLFNNASSAALSEASDKSNASAIMLFINSCIGFLGNYIVGSFVPRSLFSLPAVFFAVGVIMLILWIILAISSKKHQRSSH
ncbi:MAG: MFS transporter [Verrucomicrobia bacterium]|nr:MFS transporter [Verrucomicrobiota bacterium]